MPQSFKRKYIPRSKATLSAVRSKIMKMGMKPYGGPGPNRGGRHSEIFRQSYEITATTTAGGDYGVDITPTAANIPGFTNYAALYQQYKVLNYTVRWIPVWQPPVATGGISNSVMYVAYDPTAAAAPSAASDLLGYRNLKIRNTFRPWSMKVYPQVFDALDGTGYGTQASRRTWIDVGNTGVVLHGLKVYVENTNVNTGVIGKFVISFHFVCRNQV